ncbi:MAG: cob(I)yrinic acid a,c-diamide adenosyltransferase [Dysgonamonadaceae bacterium]|jgi:cob(I)alamin adenosyltransferase|nr:cob(I)yrinic acid a,c-diamide adenosyltransferase [Dysgonamonadaceae bacterium]
MEKSKLYTRTGDRGTTSLIGGKRVPKTDARLEAYGTLDELNAFVGLLIEESGQSHDRELLSRIQSLLFSAGSMLAAEGNHCKPTIGTAEVGLLESEIDRIDGSLPRLQTFVLPGGTKGNALAHVCRTVCRRAERDIYRIPEIPDSYEQLLIFMNRLSDYFFVLARKLCLEHHEHEKKWYNSCE